MSGGLCNHLSKAKIIDEVQEKSHLSVCWCSQVLRSVIRPCEHWKVEISKNPDVTFCLDSYRFYTDR